MEQSLKEQLAAAHAELQAVAQEQQKRADANTKVNAEIARLDGLRAASAAADEHAAQVSARRHLGEATDAEAHAARQAADGAAAAAAGAERAIIQLQREAELVQSRYMDAIAPGEAAQNVCNQLRSAVLHESANEAAVEYINAVAAARDALVKLIGHAKALSRIQGAQPFVSFFHAKMDVPAFPALHAFRPNLHHRLDVSVGVNGDVERAADSIVSKLRDDGYAF
jgi:hypothetical protein